MTAETPIDFEAAWIRLWVWAGCPDAKEWLALMEPQVSQLTAAIKASSDDPAAVILDVAGQATDEPYEWYWAAAVHVWPSIPALLNARSPAGQRAETLRLFDAFGLSMHWFVREWREDGADPSALRPFGSTTQQDISAYIIARVFVRPIPESLIVDIRQLADRENRAAFERVHAEVSQ